MINVADLMITSLETIEGFEIGTSDFLFALDELQDTSIANSEEKVDVTGKGGRKLTNIKRNKTVTISGTSGVISGGLLSMQTGGEFDNGDVEVMWPDYLTVASNAATTTYTAVGTAGAEIVSLYVKSDAGVAIKTLTQVAETPAAGQFTYANKTLTFADGDIEDGTSIVVYYKRKITADRLVNDSDTYSKKCQLYINALAEDKCANVYRVQFYIPKADFSGEFSIDLGSDQTTHPFEAEALAGACGLGGKLWDYTIFGADVADVA